MIRIAEPWILLATPAVLLVLLILARRGAQDLSTLRRVASLSIRSGMALALLLASTGTIAVQSTPLSPSVIFCVDVSESVDDPSLEAALQTIDCIARNVIDRGGSVSLVAFAEHAAVLRTPKQEPIAFDAPMREHLFWRRTLAELKRASEENGAETNGRSDSLTNWRDSLGVLGTDSSRAVAAAESLFQPHADNHIVVFTDGRDTRMSRPSLHERITWVRLPNPHRHDLVVARLDAPLAVRQGEPFTLRVDVHASHPGEITLALAVDDSVQTASVERFRIGAPGPATLTLDAPEAMRSLPSGLHRLLVIASQEGDEEPRNNQAFASVTILGRPEVLLVEGAPNEGETIARILTAQQIGHKKISVEQVGAHLHDLQRYDTVILAGATPAALRAADVTSLREYLENGGGLLVMASSRWSTLSSFDRADFAPLLPLAWVPSSKPSGSDTSPPGPKPPISQADAQPTRVLAPTIALLLLIDKSGSMSGPNIQLAREACIATAETLTDQDYVGILAFDVRPVWIVEWSRADSVDLITRKLLRLQASGGTNIYPALLEAQRTFRTDPRAMAAGVRHAVLLSDGITPPAAFHEVLAEMAREGITVSTVCVGNAEFDGRLMTEIARAGRGRFLFTSSFKDVPRIFTNEAKFIIKQVADQTTPGAPPVPPPPDTPPQDHTQPAPTRTSIPVKLLDAHEITKGIGPDLPSLRGIIGSRRRETAYVPLATPEGNPVLAVWRYGLGKSAVWTSDLGGPWSQEWMPYANTARLFAQMVRHLSTAVEDGDLASRVRVAREGSELTVRVEGASAEDPLELHVLAPQRQRLPFSAPTDGSRTASIQLEPSGVPYSLAIVRGGAREERFPLQAMQPYPLELAAPREAPFRQLATLPVALADLPRFVPSPPLEKEKPLDLTPWFLLVALALLPLDVALRRLRW